MKTGRAISVVQVNHGYDRGLVDPDELLDRYRTLTGWSDAIAGAGCGPVAVVQRFHRDACITRNGVPYVFTAGTTWAIAQAVRSLRPDVAHVNGLVFPARTWVLRQLLDRAVSVVVQNHSDGGAVGRSPRLRLAGRVTRKAVDAFLFAAPEHGEEWRRAGFIGPRQPTYQVMEASTDLQPVPRASARAASGITGSPAVLWVGRLNANKDPLTVLDAFERFSVDAPAATLTMIYGADDLLDAVRDRVGRSELLNARVRLVGIVAHDLMPQFFSAADLFVLGSHHEGSGYSLIEACACGAIPVVTDIPTFRLLTAGIGSLWRPGDADSCARALKAAACRAQDGERARLAEHFANQLSWDAVGRRALAIYEDVVRSRQG